jgi:hydroxyatrazine ethylaminohydrolase
MVNGKVVWRDGVMTGIDERVMAEKAERACTHAIRSRSAAYSL